jgi:two-component system response regulator HydG
MASVIRGRILVVDDHVQMGGLLADQLGDAGYLVEVADGGGAAVRMVRAAIPDLVVTDLRMQEVDGLDVLDAVRAIDPGVPVIVMTAFGAVDTAVEAMRRGAYHYLTKPFQLREVLLFVQRALADRGLRSTGTLRRRAAERETALSSLVGSSAAMAQLHARIRMVAASSAPALITGESGSGKELVARALHAASPRRDFPFVPVGCGALDLGRLQAELFGDPAQGADRPGVFAAAHGGTLFLDEIGDMPPEAQAKLLRVIEDGEVRTGGADAPRRVDVRVMAATHQRLEDSPQIRPDLLFRLNVIQIQVPPLRDRLEDLPALVDLFIERARARTPAARARRLSPRALARLQAHSWPGNVRELENVVERFVLLSQQEEVGPEDLDGISGSVPPSPLEAAAHRVMTLHELETRYVSWVVSVCGGDEERAAELLGVPAADLPRA